MHVLASSFHEDLSPIVVIVAGTRGYTIKAVLVIITGIGMIAAIEVAIVFCTHVSTTSPRLIANTKVFNAPGLFTAILLAKFCHGCSLF